MSAMKGLNISVSDASNLLVDPTEEGLDGNRRLFENSQEKHQLRLGLEALLKVR